MKAILIQISILLVIFLIVVIVVAVIVRNIRRKVERFSRQVFGTSSLREGFEKTEMEYAMTPKSVAGMTSLYLPKVTRDFPDFSYDEMKKKAENAVTSFLLAIHSRDVNRLQEGNEELQNKLKNRLADLAGRECKEFYENIKIHRTEMTDYKKRDGRCIITFQTSIEYVHYQTDRNGQVISGRRDLKEQSRYETDLIYIQDRALANQDVDGVLGLNCPNCGAPIKALGSKECPYCGSAVQELNIHAWSFSDVREK